MSKNKESTPDFESAMLELEEVVSRIETGNLSLEESLKEFEKGIALSRVCQKALTEAEQRVKILTKSVENADIEEDFDSLNEPQNT